MKWAVYLGTLTHLIIHLFLIFHNIPRHLYGSILSKVRQWHRLLHIKEIAAIRRFVLFLHSGSYIPELCSFMTCSPLLCFVRAVDEIHSSLSVLKMICKHTLTARTNKELSVQGSASLYIYTHTHTEYVL